jgi:P pilus assembly chaperone PapD
MIVAVNIEGKLFVEPKPVSSPKNPVVPRQVKRRKLAHNPTACHARVSSATLR